MENVIQCILSGHLFLWSRSRSLHLYLSLSVALFSHRSRLVGTFVLSADIRYWYFLQIHNNWINTHERHSSLHEHDQHTHTPRHTYDWRSAPALFHFIWLYILSLLCTTASTGINGSLNDWAQHWYRLLLTHTHSVLFSSSLFDRRYFYYFISVSLPLFLSLSSQPLDNWWDYFWLTSIAHTTFSCPFHLWLKVEVSS